MDLPSRKIKQGELENRQKKTSMVGFRDFPMATLKPWPKKTAAIDGAG